MTPQRALFRPEDPELTELTPPEGVQTRKSRVSRPEDPELTELTPLRGPKVVPEGVKPGKVGFPGLDTRN